MAKNALTNYLGFEQVGKAVLTWDKAKDGSKKGLRIHEHTDANHCLLSLWGDKGEINIIPNTLAAGAILLSWTVHQGCLVISQ